MTRDRSAVRREATALVATPGTVVLRSATTARSTGILMACRASTSLSSAVLTVVGPIPLAPVYVVRVIPRSRAASFTLATNAS
ncbi:hypothetical protein AB0E67_11270 [Streptomyces sp. NPDC032161]|uniref:hypothetical protein n=1 Tax=unclassified Streptomyces TaxID=2593676 RepID=UPI003408FAB2